MLRVVLVIGVAIGLYLRTWQYDFVHVDDDELIIDAQTELSASEGAWRAFGKQYFSGKARDHAYYRPLVTASYALDAHVGGKAAASYHRTNGILHACAAALLFLWLRSRGCRDNSALMGGLAFAVHPALAEAVAWIPGRPDVLMTVFALLAWHLHSRAVKVGDRLSQLGHIVAWLLALLSKEAAIVLPMLWVLEAVVLRRRPIRRSVEPWMAWGWGCALLVYVSARASALSGTPGAGLGLAGVTLSGILANMPVLLSSLGKLVLPLELSVLAIPEDTLLWPGAAASAALAAVAWRLPATRPVIWFSVLGYAALMLPSLPATNLLVLECRLYLPAVPLVLLFCCVVEAPAIPRRIAWVFAGLVVTVLALCTHGYLDAFRDRRAFAEAAVKGSPHSALAHKNLGIIHHIAGQRDKAWQEYQEAVQLDASEPIVHNNLGVILMAQGQLGGAERELRKELEINPGYADAHHNLAIVLRATGRSERAASHWLASLDGSANDVEALTALSAYFESRDPAKAESYRKMLDVARAKR